jgi:hypothetical protein
MLMSPRVLQRSLLMLAAFVLTSLDFTFGACAADNPKACLDHIRRGEGDPILCQIALQTTPDDRTSIATMTAGVLLDADCQITIQLERRVVDSVRQASKAVDIPGQEVSCGIVTNGGPLMTLLVVGGRLFFDHGRATDFEPAIQIKEGLPPALGRTFLRFAVNGTDLRQGVVAAINQFLANERNDGQKHWSEE